MKRLATVALALSLTAAALAANAPAGRSDTASLGAVEARVNAQVDARIRTLLDDLRR